MTETFCTLFSKHDFENEWFYYHLNLNYEKRHVIGERISEFQGVIHILFL